MPFKAINNINLYYEQHGQGEDLILIGGLTTNHLVWTAVLPALAAKYKVLIFDNRGAGQSTVPSECYTIQEMAADVIALMDHLNIKQAHMLGHSMGGLVLQQLLLDQPIRIHKAIVSNSAAKMPLISMVAMWSSAKLAEAGVRPEVILENVLPWLFSNDYLSKLQIPELIHLMLQDPYPQTPAGYVGQMQAIESFDLHDQIQTIKHETLIMAGRHDILTPLHCAEQIHHEINFSKLHILEHAAHMPHFECTKAFIDTILTFLN